MTFRHNILTGSVCGKKSMKIINEDVKRERKCKEDYSLVFLGDRVSQGMNYHRHFPFSGFGPLLFRA